MFESVEKDTKPTISQKVLSMFEVSISSHEVNSYMSFRYCTVTAQSIIKR